MVPGITGSNEGSFQEVSGLSVTITPLEVKEGAKTGSVTACRNGLNTATWCSGEACLPAHR